MKPEPHLAEEQWETVGHCICGCGNELQKMPGCPAKWRMQYAHCECESREDEADDNDDVKEPEVNPWNEAQDQGEEKDVEANANAVPNAVGADTA